MNFSTSPKKALLWLASLVVVFAAYFGLHRSSTLPDTMTPEARAKLVQVSEKEREGEEGEYEEEEDKADRPDLALEQDAELTRDPNTLTVPRERLVAAFAYNEAQRAQARLSGGMLSAASWVERGPTNVGGRIRSLLLDPADATGNTLWAGAVGGGLWKSTNAMSTTPSWTNVNGFLSNLAVTAIVADPGTATRYCGTGEGFFNADAIQGAGVWKSTDGGATWSQLAATNNSNFYYIQKMAVHPVTHDVYAATRTGLYRSQNGGGSWTLVLASSRVTDIELAADNTLFVSAGLSAADGIYRSTRGDLGSWTKLNTLAGSGLPTSGYERIELSCAPSDANRVYAVFENTSNGLLNVYRSMDKGTTWEVTSRPGATATNPTFDFTNGQAWYNLISAVAPTDPDLLYVGGLDIYRTKNADTLAASITWEKETGWSLPTTSPYYVHADNHAIIFGATNDIAFFGNDGGVFLSRDASQTNGGNSPTFSSLNRGLNVTQFYAVAAHPTNPNYYLAGAQDNGTQKFTTAGLGTTTVATGGDGGFCFIDQLNPSYQFTSYVYNQYRRSSNGGASFATINISSTVGQFINSCDYDSKLKTLYASYGSGTYLAWLNAHTSGTANATPRSLGTGTGTPTHFTVSKTVRNRVYIGTNSGRILRVDSASTTSPIVSTLRIGSSGTSVSCIAVDPNDETHLLATYSNYGTASVFESIDAGVTWTNVEGSLPDMPVRWALIDPSNRRRAMLATEMGVYTTEQLDGSGTSWTPANNGPVNVRVDMLRMRPDGMVVAATHGRGLFTTDVVLSAKKASAGASNLISNAYPNPFDQQVTMELARPVSGRVQVSLLDVSGRQVMSTAVAASGRSVTVATPAGLAAGVYILKVQAGKETATKRVLHK
ncbi:T9SS type A sorting domain-containing protein [Hymenobacter busanensis]|uniref:T9SS type A sorting domain-containing protein n=1 Tax=Hymenobacter busanensis TaxID=2607656 RepID=A0A7L5A0K0_9BACT|nr:T9SS type A sorting domain-containing protein [Hymenobacter busanensis]KAA9331362.1 T9SS type A sorting domain-containing protein [Hymenobacter busanensis]QHJ08515.1 T9SS type A sorting domain-containing protein [Hymenobacter busanensis]